MLPHGYVSYVLLFSSRIRLCASEDVGNADPMAITVAVSAAQAVERVGMPAPFYHTSPLSFEYIPKPHQA